MSDLTLEVLMEAKKKLDSTCNKGPAYARVPSLFAMIPNKHMCSIAQAKTHRKQRINKKYRKKYGFVEVPWDFVYTTGDNMIAHPKTIESIKETLGKAQGGPTMFDFFDGQLR